MQRMLFRARGFTLLELIVSITIMVILAGVMIPSIVSVRDSVLRDQCRDQMERIGEAILKRAEYLARSPEFVHALVMNPPTAFDYLAIAANTPCSTTYFDRTIINYYPFFSTQAPDYPGDEDSLPVAFLEKLTTPSTETGAFTFWIPQFECDAVSHDLNDGGPYLGSAKSSSGSSIGKTYIYQDPWDNDVWTDFPSPGPCCPIDVGVGMNQIWRTIVWAGGANASAPSGIDDLQANLHLYPVLSKTCHEKIEVINQAILKYNESYLVDEPLRGQGGPIPYWNYNQTQFAEDLETDGSGNFVRPWNQVRTSYALLVRRGFLDRPHHKDTSGNLQPTEYYAIDPWGWAFRTDVQYDNEISIANTGPVLRVISVPMSQCLAGETCPPTTASYPPP